MVQSIRIVRRTSQFARMRRFYEDQLDMRPTAFWDRGDDDRGVVLVFNGRTSATSVEIVASPPPDSGGEGRSAPDDRTTVAIEVDNIGDRHEQLLARGVTTEREPQYTTWGHRTLLVRDPDGFGISFFQDMNR